LVDSIDGLTEKRATTRINHLQTVYDIMCKHYTKPILSNRIDTLANGVLNCVNRGTSDKEVILGLETITVITITIGRRQQTSHKFSSDNAGQLGDETLQRLRDTLTAKCIEGKPNETNQNIRHAALFSLAMYGFIEDDSRDLVVGLLSTYENEYWRKEKDMNVLAQAITSWSLMASAVPMYLHVQVLLRRVKSKLIKLLTKNDLGVKMSSGEALAMLYQSYYDTQGDDEEEGLEETLGEIDHELLEKLQQLSTQTNKQVAKRDRSVQKSSFRDIVDTIEDGTSPEIKVVIKKNTLTFDTWRSIIQYNAFKSVLGSGLIQHFTNNPLVQEVFGVQGHDFDERAARKLNKGEKQAIFSKKAAHKKLNTIEKATKTRSAHDLTLLDNNDE
jgi:hypothetical protein